MRNAEVEAQLKPKAFAPKPMRNAEAEVDQDGNLRADADAQLKSRVDGVGNQRV